MLKRTRICRWGDAEQSPANALERKYGIDRARVAGWMKVWRGSGEEAVDYFCVRRANSLCQRSGCAKWGKLAVG